MDRDSNGTQFNFDNAEPADPIFTDSPPLSKNAAPQSTNGIRPHVPAKDAVVLVRKRIRSSKDEGYNDNKSRFQKPAISRFPKNGTVAKAVDRSGNQGTRNDSVAIKASQGKDALQRSHDVFTSTRPQVELFLLPLNAKDESPWKIYNEEHTIELGGRVVVAERKHPAYGLAVVKEFSGDDTDGKLSKLR